jgi:hypothetical protein
VLISTGRDMDLTETALTLRGIDSSMEIIVLMDPEGTGDPVARAIPNYRQLPN